MRNQFSGLREFIRRWDGAPGGAAREGRVNRGGRAGRINLEGTAACSRARTYSRSEVEFARSIEPGVRELVFELIETFDCITYSSCEGHGAHDRPVSYSPRHVGIVPRGPEEYGRLLRALSRIASGANREAASKSVAVKVAERALSSDDLSMPCLEILFERTAGDPNVYFLELDSIYRLFLRRLAEEKGGGAALIPGTKNR